MHIPPPQKEHQWLHRLVGTWRYQHECDMGPDQPPALATGIETVRSLGGLWTIGEGEGSTPDGGRSQSIMTLGFDPALNRFVGSFIASVMTHFWPYNGSLDASESKLILDSEGPSFTDEGRLAKYQDIIEFVDDNHRTLLSQYLGDDGQWHRFMTADYYREA